MIFNFAYDDDVDFTRRVQVFTPTGDLVNLTGFSARMMIRRRIGDETPLISLASGTNNLILHANGEIDIYIDEAMVAQLGRENVYDLEVVDLSGKVSRPLQGKMYVLDEDYNTYGSINS